MNRHADDHEPMPTVDIEKSGSTANNSTPSNSRDQQALNDTQAVQPASAQLETSSQAPTVSHPIGQDADATQDFELSFSAPATGPKSLNVAGYDILGELGRGAMGVVYKARHQRADRIVALKVLINTTHAQPKEIERFEIEAKAAARLQHPNIVQVYDVGQTGDLPYFTQEFVGGGTLARRLARDMLSHEQAARMMLTLAHAIAYAHSRGIVHRDLKPANILMDENDSPKIADFGLARRMEDESHLTKDGTIIGTPAYMPPEQAYGSAEEIGPHSDVYTLGAILYELLVGRAPFKGSSVWEVIELVRTAEPVRPTEIERSVPRDLETICLKCLNKDPAKRYASAQDLADDLQRYLNLEPILARPAGRIERFVRLCRRHPSEAKLIGLVAVLLLLTTAGSIWTAMRISHDRDRIQREEELAKNRLKSRNDTIFQIVNRMPQKLDGLPFSKAAAEELALLTQEALEADVENSKEDSAADSSRKFGLSGAAIRRGILARNLLSNYLPRGDSKEEVDKLFQEAEEHFQTAYRLNKEVYDSGQGDLAKAQGNMALVLGYQATLYALAKRGPEPLPLMKRAVELREAAIREPTAEDPLNKRRAALAHTQAELIDIELDRLGQIEDLGEQKKLAAELAVIAETACNSLSEILDDNSLSVDLKRSAQRGLALAARNMSKCATITQDDALAMKGYEIATAQYQQLIKADPDQFNHKAMLQQVADSFGDYLLVQHQDPVKARAQYVTSMSIIRNMKKEYRIALLDDQWLMEYYRLGMAAYASKNSEQTRRYFERAELICDIQLREIEDDKANTDSLRTWEKRCLLMLIHAWAGHVEPAALMARRVRQRFANEPPSKATSLRLAHAAFAFGLAAMSVAESNRPAAHNEALETLKLAIKAGYNNVQYLRTDPDATGLRAIPEFEAIVAALEKSSSADQSSNISVPNK